MYYVRIVSVLTKLKYWNVPIPKSIFRDLQACQLSPNSIQNNHDKKCIVDHTIYNIFMSSTNNL